MGTASGGGDRRFLIPLGMRCVASQTSRANVDT